jgi:hypothetical protein
VRIERVTPVLPTGVSSWRVDLPLPLAIAAALAAAACGAALAWRILRVDE